MTLAWMLPTMALAQPTIIVEPRTQFAWENKFVSLSVTATETAPVTYQWRFNGSDIADATHAYFELATIQLTNDGEYRVVVADTTGSVTSQVARVLVRAWPQPTGPRIPELASLDDTMQSALRHRAVPGGSLAVVKDGRLVFARGYGYADVENNEPVQPDSLFRTGSLPKTITAATVMKLVEAAKLDLETPAFGLLNLEVPNYPGAVFDSRLTNITVRQLLNHSGGWNHNTAEDPLGRTGFDSSYWPDRMTQDLGLTAPPTSMDIVRWMMGKPLQFDPGTQFFYSNFGFLVAGRVIEKVTGQAYGTAGRQFLAPAGLTRMRLGLNTRAERAPGEVVYYLHPNPGILGDFAEIEPKPLNFDLPYAYPVTDADGGWMASAMDYARFVAAIDGDSSYPDILSADSVTTMTARPTAPPANADGYFGLGWESISPSTGVWYHTGADIGNSSISMKRTNGVIFVFMQNAWPGFLDLFNTGPVTLDNIPQWPTNDLFAATLSYDAWRAKYFSANELADPTVSGEAADPDGDGVVNLLEYAHGTDPRTPSAPPRLAASLRTVDGRPFLAVSFRRLLLAHELNYTLEASPDLKTWSVVNGEADEPVLNADGTLTTTLRVAPLENSHALFLRLLVSRTPVP